MSVDSTDKKTSTNESLADQPYVIVHKIKQSWMKSILSITIGSTNV